MKKIGIKLYAKNEFAKYNSNPISPDKKTIRLRLLNHCSKDKMISSFDRILKERYNVQYVIDDSYNVVINQVFGDEKITNNNAVKIFYTGESVTPKIDDYDLSIGFDHIDDPKYIRITLP